MRFILGQPKPHNRFGRVLKSGLQKLANPCDAYCDCLDCLIGDSYQQQREEYQWTMTHSHYVIMGGFAIVPGEQQSPARYWHKYLQQCHEDRLTISTEGVQFLANLDPALIPQLSTVEIKDKSKASGMAKAFVCAQALWFCAQCVARLSQDLKISLLELNTFAHAMCTLLVYILWWDKPLDIEEPTIIPPTGPAQAVIALLCLASEFGSTLR